MDQKSLPFDEDDGSIGHPAPVACGASDKKNEIIDLSLPIPSGHGDA